MLNSSLHTYHFVNERRSPLNSEIDFLQLIKTIQYLNKHTLPHYRAEKNYTENLRKFFDVILENSEQLQKEMVTSLGYSPEDAHEDFEDSLYLLKQLITTQAEFKPSFTIPQRFIAVYGSWSSPLYRFFKSIVPALTQQCSVLVFCEPEASSIYSQLAEWISTSELGLNRVAVLPITNKEVLEALLEHPSLQGIEMQSHLYHSSFFRKHCHLPEKNYNLHFGAHNPVIILNDASPKYVAEMLNDSLRFHQRSEIRFNRWFVQEKILPEVIEVLQQYSQTKIKGSFGQITSQQYQQAFDQQLKDLSASKNWLNPLKNSIFNVCTDFSNCSPLHQTELLGPLLTITRVKNIAEATKFANTTNYSNATCILTESDEKYLEAASQQRTPFVFKNKRPHLFDTCLDSGDRFCAFKTTPQAAYIHRTIVY